MLAAKAGRFFSSAICIMMGLGGAVVAMGGRCAMPTSTSKNNNTVCTLCVAVWALVGLVCMA